MADCDDDILEGTICLYMGSVAQGGPPTDARHQLQYDKGAFLGAREQPFTL
jgi:hypothetical protein